MPLFHYNLSWIEVNPTALGSFSKMREDLTAMTVVATAVFLWILPDQFMSQPFVF